MKNLIDLIKIKEINRQTNIKVLRSPLFGGSY